MDVRERLERLARGETIRAARWQPGVYLRMSLSGLELYPGGTLYQGVELSRGSERWEVCQSPGLTVRERRKALTEGACLRRRWWSVGRVVHCYGGRVVGADDSATLVSLLDEGVTDWEVAS